jgi:hypothetical protein
MSHPCRYKGWRWLVFSFRRSAAILSNRGNQTRSREPTPSRDLQTAFVREAASPAHRTPFAWLADRSDQYGHGISCPISRTPFAGTADHPDQSTGTACRAPSAGRRLRGWRTALISTGTACRAPSAGRRLRGWRTARIRVRARHIVPHQPDAVCGDGRPSGSEYGHGISCPISRTPFAGMADRPDQSTGTACRAPSAGRRLRGRQTIRIRVRARHAVPHQPDAVCGDGGPPGSEYGHGMPCPISRTPFAGMADRPDQSTGTACRAPSAGRRLRGWQTARIRVRARHAVPHQPDAVCGDGRPPGSEYGHGMPCPISRTPFAGTADRPDQSTGTACRAP